MISSLAAIYSDKDLFLKFVSTLPEDVEKIFGPRKNGRTDLDGKPKSRRKSSTPKEKATEAVPKLEKKEKEKEKEEETPKSKTA